MTPDETVGTPNADCRRQLAEALSKLESMKTEKENAEGHARDWKFSCSQRDLNITRLEEEVRRLKNSVEVTERMRQQEAESRIKHQRSFDEMHKIAQEVIKERDVANLQIRLLQELVHEAIEQGDITVHLEPCPGDDTCSCEPARILNEAMAGYTEKRVCEHEWSHIEDHHVFCPKCKATADLCWTCEKPKPCGTEHRS